MDINQLRKMPSLFLPQMATICVITINILLTILTCAALIFSGKLLPLFIVGFVQILVASSFISIVMAIWSKSPFTIAHAQNDSLPLYAAMTASMFSTLYVAGKMNITPLFAIGLATVLTGILFCLLGSLKLGNLISYAPYPVISGFLGGIGWFIFYQAFTIAIPEFTHFSLVLLEPNLLIQWLPAVIFSLIILFFANRYNNPLILPLGTLIGIALFYGAITILNIPLQQIREHGFLFDIMAPPGKVYENYLNTLRQMSFSLSWQTIMQQATFLFAIVLINLFGILLNQTGLEILVKKSMNFNKELQITGIANAFAGLLGGMAGFASVIGTSLNYSFQSRASRSSRSIGIWCGVLCLLVLLLDLKFFSYFPRMFLSGLLMFFGLSFIKDWAIDVRKTITTMDYIIVLSIVLVIALLGIVKGILIGIIISALIFIINYSKINTIKYKFTGKLIHSNKLRSPIEEETLKTHGEEILYYKLQNYLFFGNANKLFTDVQSKLSHTNTIKFIIYDFSDVIGIDTSVVLSFEKIILLAQENHIILLLTNMNERAHNLFERQGLLNKSEHLHIYQTYDAALEYSEDEILHQYLGKQIKQPQAIPLEKQLLGFIEPSYKHYLESIKNIFETKFLKKGDYLFRKGEKTNEIYYIQSGELSIVIEDYPTGIKRRIRTIESGNTVGEMSLFLKEPRSASVYVEKDSFLEVITEKSLQKLEIEHPQIAAAFFRYMLYISSERIKHTNKQIEILKK